METKPGARDKFNPKYDAQFIRKSPTDKLKKSNFDKQDNNSQNEISPFKNHSQKMIEIGGNDTKHNVKPAEVYNQKYDALRDEFTTQFIRKSTTNKIKKSNFVKLDNHSLNETSNSVINHSQKMFDIEDSDEKINVKPSKVYDPQHHRLPRKKVAIGQYSEYMKFKNSSSPNAQMKRMEISETKSGGSMNEDLKESFELFKSPSLNKPEKENKSLMNDTLRDITITNSGTITNTPQFKNSPNLLKNNTKRHLKSSIIRNGKEIADLIIFCKREFDTFKSYYNQWLDFREQAISLLEQIVMIINQSPKKNITMKHVITAIKIATTVTKLIPHPAATIASKVADAFVGLLSNFLGNVNAKEEDVNAKEFEIKEIFQRDIHSSSYVYIYGVQCSSQFQETCNAISQFHEQLLEGGYQSIINNVEVLEFMNEITEYNITNTHVFYKRLRMCYQRLIKCSNSEESRAFIRVFEDVPDAISVIGLLPWKFNTDGFDNSIVQSAWGELFILFQDGNQAATDAILKKIQNCLFFLKKEHVILSLNVRNLFKDTFK